MPAQYSVSACKENRDPLREVKLVSFCNWIVNCWWCNSDPAVLTCSSLNHQGGISILHSIFPYSSHLDIGLLASCINEECYEYTSCQYQVSELKIEEH